MFDPNAPQGPHFHGPPQQPGYVHQQPGPQQPGDVQQPPTGMFIRTVIAMRKIIPTLALAATLALAGCAGTRSDSVGGSTPTPSAPTTFTALGTLKTDASLDEPAAKGGYCFQDKYDDVAKGSAVTVTDASGTVVALGELGYPTVVDTFESGGKEYAMDCSYTFTVTGIPLGHNFYGFEVAHRGVVRMTAEKATTPALTLGD